MKQTARQVALGALGAFRRNGAWSDGYLKTAIRTAELDVREAALATQLTYGVLQNRMLCDFYIDTYSSVKRNKITPKILDVLRLGVYQLVFLERVPAHAIVNEAVRVARRDNPHVAGFVNALLRTIDRKRDLLPVPESLSIRYSHPQWIVDKLTKQYGIELCEKILQANNEIPPITARINPLIGTVEDACAILSAEPHPWLSGCVILHHTGDISEQPAYQTGLITVQDPASQLAALTVGVTPGMHVLDVCAAPGGKSFVMAEEMNGTGQVMACDIHPHKISILEAGAKRLHLSNVQACLRDAAAPHPTYAGMFDAVLADVPCSGLGIIRKKPDIRYKDATEVAALPALQQKILQAAARAVRPGGVLVYSTCTILHEENELVVEAFLREHSEFHLEPFVLPEPIGQTNGIRTLLPHEFQTDGFFISKLRRMA